MHAWKAFKTLTIAVRADFWPGALVGQPRSLWSLPEDARVSGPGSHTTATEIEAALPQTDKIKKPYEEQS